MLSHPPGRFTDCDSARIIVFAITTHYELGPKAGQDNLLAFSGLADALRLRFAKMAAVVDRTSNASFEKQSLKVLGTQTSGPFLQVPRLHRPRIQSLHRPCVMRIQLCQCS